MKKIFIVLALLIAAAGFTPAHAQSSIQSGDLIKSNAAPAVYYFGADGKRYVFPNDKTYFTWYADFANVKTISVGDLAGIPIGGNVTYRPGTRMLKIQSDPKVYAISKNGILRAIGSEAVATALYGSTWNKQIDDLSDSFFVNYKVGAPVAAAAEYAKEDLKRGAPSVNVDKLLVAPPAGFIDVKAGTAAFTPSAMTVASGTKVVWIVLDSSMPHIASGPHPTHTLLPDLTSGPLGMGQSYAYTYSASGTWPYHNHNGAEQKGTVTVTAQ